MTRHVNFNRFPGMGDLPGDNSNPNSPDYVQRESVLDCPNEIGTWLAENMAEEVQVAAIEILGDWLAGPRDGYAEAKFHRELMEFAKKCETAIERHETKAREDNA